MGLRKAGWAPASCALLGLAVGESAWGLSRQALDFAWPQLGHGQFLGLGALLGLAWWAVQSLGWRLAFGVERAEGGAVAAWSSLPFLLGLLWRPLLRVSLPPPHDLSSRKLQILLAAQLVGGLWCSLALGIRALRRSGLLEALAPRTAALRLGGLALLFYQLNGLWIGQWNMTGDAPHYLLMAHSLAYDGDLDLANNYRDRDWKRFYDYNWELLPQEGPRANGQVVPEHKPGLPMLLAAPYRVLGDSGARWMLALLAAAGSGLFYALCLRLGFTQPLALLGWALFSFSAPWMSQSQSVMAELIGGAGFLAVLCAWQGLLPASTGWASLGFLFWIHLRYNVLGLALTACAAWGGGRAAWRRTAIPLSLVLASLGLSMAANHLLFGSNDPTEIRQMSLAQLFNPLGALRYASGILLDQEFGLLSTTAAFALAPLGLRALWSRERPWFWQTLLPSLAYFSLIASFPYWWSAMAPNRFMACLAPVMALWALECWRAWGPRPLFKALAAYSWAWAAAMAILPWLNFSKTNGQNWVLRIIGSKLNTDLCGYFPSFILNTPLSYAWVAGLLLALAAAWKRLGPPRPA